MLSSAKKGIYVIRTLFGATYPFLVSLLYLSAGSSEGIALTATLHS